MKGKRLTALTLALTVLCSVESAPFYDIQSEAASETAQETNGYRYSLPASVSGKPTFLYGDLNEDNTLTALDLTMLKRAVLTDAPYDEKADLDADGDVDADDAARLQSYLLTNTHSLWVYTSYDSDEDGLNDYLEHLLQSDPNNSDTDKDGLSDYEEIARTSTDPTVSDSLKTGVSDAEADSDEDGLTNQEEIALGSDALNPDTDGDGLDDAYEVKTLLTDCLKMDSDGDGLSDDEEELLGLDPLKEATNGTPDRERIIKQIIPADAPLLSTINTEENAYDLSVEIEAAGYAPYRLTVSNSIHSSILKNGSAVGITPELLYSTDFPVKSVTLHFTIKKPFRDNVSHYFTTRDSDYYEIPAALDGIKRLNVFRYHEKLGFAVPMYTEYDTENFVVSVKLDNFASSEDAISNEIGSYSLVDMEVWGEMMRTPADENTKQDAAQKPMQSKPMAQIMTEPLDFVKKQLEAIDDALYNRIYMNYSTYEKQDHTKDKTKIVTGAFGNKYGRFDKAGLTWAEAEKYCELRGGHLVVITSAEEEAVVENLVRQGSLGCYWLGGTMSGSALKWVTGEPTTFTNWTKGQPDHIGSENALMMYRQSNPVVKFDTSLQWNNIYNSGTYPNEAFFTPANFGLVCEWERGTAIKDIDEGLFSLMSATGSLVLSAPLDASNDADSDLDGISDWDEINHALTEEISGKTDATSVSWNQVQRYANKHMNLSAEESQQLFEKITLVLKGECDITLFLTDPCNHDTDDDQIVDADDPQPTQKADPRFQQVSGYDYDPEIDFVNIRNERSQKCYDTIGDEHLITEILWEANRSPLANEMLGCIVFALTHDFPIMPTVTADLCALLMTLGHGFDWGPNPQRAFTANNAMDKASEALSRYFAGCNEPYRYSASEVCESTAVSSKNLEHLHTNLTWAMRYAEQTLQDHTSTVFATTSNAKLKAFCNVDRGCTGDGVPCNASIPNRLHGYHAAATSDDSPYFNYRNRDWFNAIGEAPCAIVADVSRNGNQYTMKYRYIFKDIYEWTAHYDNGIYSETNPFDLNKINDLEYALHFMHESGYAKEYLMEGEFEGTITWTAGQTAFDGDVFKTIKETLKKQVSLINWLNGNEYTRFENQVSNKPRSKEVWDTAYIDILMIFQ